MKFGLKSHVGRLRSNNEDYVKGSIIKNPAGEAGLFIIADGMGGHEKGEVASKIAVETAFEYLSEKIQSIPLRKRDIVNSIVEAFESSNKEIYLKARQNSEYFGMGTTMTILLVYNDDIIIGNVGDSRCYLYSKDCGLSQVTKDNSLVQEMLEKGLISEDEAKVHPKKNIITRAVGTDENIKVDVYEEGNKGDSLYILCTDGISNSISDFELEKILKFDYDLQEICEKAIDLANSHGGQDNISIIVVEI